MTHTAQALAVSREAGADWDAYADARGWAGVGLGPIGHHRDSEALERSNWRTLVADLESRFGPAGPSWDVPSFRHWAVGWIEELAHDTGNPAIVEYLAEVADRLDNYPVLDEQDYSDLEWAEEWCVRCDRATREMHPGARACGKFRSAEDADEIRWRWRNRHAT